MSERLPTFQMSHLSFGESVNIAGLVLRDDSGKSDVVCVELFKQYYAIY